VSGFCESLKHLSSTGVGEFVFILSYCALVSVAATSRYGFVR
jgi:hypothetical protein